MDRFTMVLKSVKADAVMIKEREGDYVLWKDVKAVLERIQESLDDCKTACIPQCFDSEESNRIIDSILLKE